MTNEWKNFKNAADVWKESVNDWDDTHMCRINKIVQWLGKLLVCCLRRDEDMFTLMWAGLSLKPTSHECESFFLKPLMDKVILFYKLYKCIYIMLVETADKYANYFKTIIYHMVTTVKYK